jgi:hypothetical protein
LIGTVTGAYIEASRRGVIGDSYRRGMVVRHHAGERPDSRLRVGGGTEALHLGTNLPIHGKDPDPAQALRVILNELAEALTIGSV